LDFQKAKQWRDFAWKAGGDFWSKVFNDEYSQELIKEISKISGLSQSNFPKTDIYKTETHIIIIMEIPGCKKEDIQIGIQNDRLAIQGLVNSPPAAYAVVSRERSYGSFERVIQLPEIVNKDNASARLDNGILEIRLPRSHQSHTRIINVE